MESYLSNETMKGYLLTGYNEAGWRDVPVREPGDYDALVRVECVAPCTTDVHQIQQTTQPSMIGYALGHEAAGVIEKVGAAVKDFKVGDRVLLPCTMADYKTTLVQRMGAKGGKFIQPHSPFHSANAWHARFVEHSLAEDADLSLAKIPDSVSYEKAVMVNDMVCTAWPAVEKLHIGFGDVIVVIGIGPVGLMGVAGCALKGAGRIIAVGHREKTKKVAIEYGATDIVDYKDGDVYEQIMALTGGQKVDGVLICGGSSATYAFNLAINLVKWGGSVSCCAFFDRDKEVALDNASLYYCGKDKEIHFTMIEDGRDAYERYLRMIEYGKLDTGKIVTHVLHGWDQLEEGLRLMGDKGNDEVIKVVVLTGDKK